ncbi:hypothetical protein, partial [Salmonella enterica]|uniref:hypothetical protein n=1 Tax=Salmonella enterica TaxID=28901 RepID=UPI003FD87532
ISQAQGGAFPDWQAVAAEARKDPAVRAAAPFIAVQSLLARGEDMRGAVVRGILPEAEVGITDLAAQLQRDGTLAQLQPGAWRIVLGGELARALG